MRSVIATGVSLCLFLAGSVGSVSAEPFPYELETGREAAVFGTSALMFGLGFVADRNYEPLTPREIAELESASVNWLDRSSLDNWSHTADKASDLLMYTTVAAPIALGFTDVGSKQPGTLAVMYLQTMALQGGTVFLLKNVISRPRPFVYNDDPDIPLALKTSRTARRSFPSGHTANSFAAMVFTATVYDRLYPDSNARGWVWGGCMTAAATTGYLRYAAGRHFPTDILAGAVIGAVAGYLVPRWHKVDPVDPGSDPAARASPGMTFAVRLGF